MAKSSAWVVLQNNKSRFLLGKRSNRVSNGGQWGLFGGTVDENENTKKGALRELYEEVGIKAKIKDLQFLWKEEHPGDKKYSYYYKLSVSNKPKTRINWETEKTKWFSIKDMEKLSEEKHFTLKSLLQRVKTSKKFFRRNTGN